VILLSIYYIIL